jgi:hypothetical protein
VAKTATQPYKVMIFLLYSDLPYIVRRSPTQLLVKVGPLARRLRVSNARLFGYFEFLRDNNYLETLEVDRGLALVTIRVPPNLQVKCQV